MQNKQLRINFSDLKNAELKFAKLRHIVKY